MKRINGFIDLQKIGIEGFLTKEKDGNSCFGWFYMEEKEYLFKTCQKEISIKDAKKDAIKELFYGFVYDALNEKNVHYDLAKYKEHYGVISKQYNVDNLNTYSLYDILNYDKKTNESPKIHSFTNIKEAYSHFFKKVSEKEIEELIKKTLECFIFQLLFGNRDLHENNIEVYDSDHPKMSPFYDFGNYGSISLKEDSNFCFSFKYDGEKRIESPKETLDTFLRLAKKEEIELLKEKMELVRQIKTRNIYDAMQDQIHAFIPLSIKRTLKKQLTDNSNYLRKYLK